MDEYKKALIRQLRAFWSYDKAVCIKTIYFGGGTPTVFGAGRLAEVLGEVFRLFNVAPDCEVTLEANPASVTKQELIALRGNGFNRISFGVQSFDDKELSALGRIHDSNQAKEALIDAADAGFERISADLMYSIPYQTLESFNGSIETLLSFGIKHVSAYPLSVEEGTPFFAEKNSLPLPSEEVEEEMYYSLCERIKSRQFIHYEVSSYAHPEHFSLHNSVYWNGGQYAGIGAGAHSLLNNKRFSCSPNIEKYINQQDQYDFFALTDYESNVSLSAEENKKEAIMLGLRTINGVMLSYIDHQKAQRLRAEGLAEQKNGRLHLTDKGYRVSNSIILFLSE